MSCNTVHPGGGRLNQFGQPNHRRRLVLSGHGKSSRAPLRVVLAFAWAAAIPTFASFCTVCARRLLFGAVVRPTAMPGLHLHARRAGRSSPSGACWFGRTARCDGHRQPVTVENRGWPALSSGLSCGTPSGCSPGQDRAGTGSVAQMAVAEKFADSRMSEFTPNLLLDPCAVERRPGWRCSSPASADGGWRARPAQRSDARRARSECFAHAAAADALMVEFRSPTCTSRAVFVFALGLVMHDFGVPMVVRFPRTVGVAGAAALPALAVVAVVDYWPGRTNSGDPRLIWALANWSAHGRRSLRCCSPTQLAASTATGSPRRPRHEPGGDPWGARPPRYGSPLLPTTRADPGALATRRRAAAEAAQPASGRRSTRAAIAEIRIGKWEHDHPGRDAFAELMKRQEGFTGRRSRRSMPHNPASSRRWRMATLLPVSGPASGCPLCDLPPHSRRRPGFRPLASLSSSRRCSRSTPAVGVLP